MIKYFLKILNKNNFFVYTSALSIFVIFLIAFNFYLKNKSVNPSDCIEESQQTALGNIAYQYCSDSSGDDGRSCTVNSDCSGACVVEHPIEKNSQGYIIGTCRLAGPKTCSQSLSKKVKSVEELDSLGTLNSCT